MRRKKKFLIAGLILLVAIGVLAYRGFQGSSAYYLGVNELKARAADNADSIYQQRIRVGGKVQEGSIDFDRTRLLVNFVITQGEDTLSVVYKGVPPDTFFQPGAEAVVEGRITPEGIFQADVLRAKCPSKYVPKKAE